MKYKRKLKPWEKNFACALAVVIVLIVFALTNEYFKQVDINLLENKSKECAVDGLGIKVLYTKEGDRYYVCNLSKEE